eukprot:9478410-Pyramimonas_sp.AAC.1
MFRHVLITSYALIIYALIIYCHAVRLAFSPRRRVKTAQESPETAARGLQERSNTAHTIWTRGQPMRRSGRHEYGLRGPMGGFRTENPSLPLQETPGRPHAPRRSPEWAPRSPQ